MAFYAEGIIKQATHFTKDALYRAMQNKDILESRALSFDSSKQLHFALGEYEGIMPYEECALGVRENEVRDIALITRVGRPVCFIITDIDESRTPIRVYLSRTVAQLRCKEEYINGLGCGDVINCRVTHIEQFGAFCDVGCGISALLPIDCMSVSRIHSPRDRVYLGEELKCVIKGIDERGRFVLSLRELLGTWEENSARFSAGETVVGIVRSIESYGTFVELAPNLAGLAEPNIALEAGQVVSVYIKSIIADKMKIKLVVLHLCEDNGFMFPLEYFDSSIHIEHWVYSAPSASRTIETHFE
ncbi:MAG: S1 RNA-binding domain-containing protein [Oscillospiraceae bacterium]